ncbi:MAG: hypothetical protein ACQKBV_10270 [Puniceicoccales bacterium]
MSEIKHSYDSAEVKEGLRNAVESVCAYLLPDGHRKGREWVVGDIKGNPGESLHVALEGDKAGHWIDFASPSDKGDLIALWMATRNLSFPEALHEAGDWLRIPQRQISRPKKGASLTGETKTPKKICIPPLDAGSISELTNLRRLRGIPSIVAMQILFDRGQFGMCYTRAGRSYLRTWIITDSTGFNAQIRRLDGEPIFGNVKAKTLPGSTASWPVGAATITPDTNTVYLCEGGPDLIALATAIWMENDGQLPADASFVAMLGAGQQIHSQALSLFAGKRVRIFSHADDAGRNSVNRWGWQLANVVDEIDYWHSDIEGEDLNDYIARHWALSDESNVCWPEMLGVQNADS